MINSNFVSVTAGSVNFFVNGTLLSNVEINSSTGVAAISTRSLPLGTDAIIATFVGTASTQGSSSSPVSVAVTGKDATSTALTASANLGIYSFSAAKHLKGMSILVSLGKVKRSRDTRLRSGQTTDSR